MNGARSVLSLLVCALAQGLARADALAHPQVLQQCSNEAEALQVLMAGWDEDLSPDGASADVLFLVSRGWWTATNELLRLVRAQSPGTDLEPARRHITALRDSALQALMLFRVGTSDSTVFTPAFQWAQSLDTIYLNVKFSSRMDGPTTILNVVDENVTIGADSLSFTATGKDKPKRIRLQLQFSGLLDPEASSWSFAAVGRVSFTLVKAKAELWPQLLSPASTRPKNMFPWLERQEVLDREIERQRRAAELRSRVEALVSGSAGVGAEGSTGGRSGGAVRTGSGRTAAGDEDDDDDDAEAAAIRAENSARRARAAAAAARAAEAAAAARAAEGGEGRMRDPSAKTPKQPAGGGAGKKGSKRRAAPEPAANVREWDERKLLDWLEAAGFGRHRRTFERHRLDGAGLAETTEDELRTELRMTIVGERKRLRLAVCRVHPNCTVTPNVVDDWGTNEVARWLDENGLGAHKGRFREQQIDGPALLELSEEELKVGDRFAVRPAPRWYRALPLPADFQGTLCASLDLTGSRLCDSRRALLPFPMPARAERDARELRARAKALPREAVRAEQRVRHHAHRDRRVG